MQEKVKEIFKKENIEYVSALAYSDCREINRGLIERAGDGFCPQSVLVFLLPYYTGETVNISRYAASLDYHIIIKEIGTRITAALEELYPEHIFRTYGDHSPINEISAALISGFGIAGDNGLLINERYGTYVFLGDIITDIPPEELGCISPMPVLSCERCGACARACPTGILRGEGADCLSAITQRKGELTASEEELMRRHNTAWGCDLCQSSCPHNREPRPTPIKEFYRERIEMLTTPMLSTMSKDEFERRAFAWRGRKTVERNLKLLGI